ncbi:uncharacterized protein MELLADRAFT_112044 [Melampsora larici-populina 98AG31]|uniref:Uncharacterized protein n=1 Tax=Melampsora larici-populina (strain 98AG31 / pathotype 3-4-7) TaxID=747676 RepID=F4S577_MELLP|nr:uncharacterized protein MELLADRAFT_112044 [Melampsora larici-populina 98AG31]EGG00207.1 hypothetical protein MELLADRAFT_112044 [Melampsora larici-populina 98AG31]
MEETLRSVLMTTPDRYHHVPKHESEERYSWRNLDEVLSFIENNPDLTKHIDTPYFSSISDEEKNNARWALKNAVKNRAYYSGNDEEKKSEAFSAISWLIAFVEDKMFELRTRVAESAKKPSRWLWHPHTMVGLMRKLQYIEASDLLYHDFETHYQKWISEAHRLKTLKDSEEGGNVYSDDRRVIVYLALVMFGNHNHEVPQSPGRVKEKITHKGGIRNSDWDVPTWILVTFEACHILETDQAFEGASKKKLPVMLKTSQSEEPYTYVDSSA